MATLVFAAHARSEHAFVAFPSYLCVGGRRALTVSGRENCDFFTMMRHPIDRLISQFFYCPRDHDIQGRPPKVRAHRKLYITALLH